MKKPRKRLDIKGYANNAAKNFSMSKLITFTVLSFVLLIMLFINIYNSHYEGVGLTFCTIVLIMIAGYAYLNIKALIIKLKK